MITKSALLRAFIGHQAKIAINFCKDFSILLNNLNDVNNHALLLLVILMLNAQNGIRMTKIMQPEKLCRLIPQLQVTVS